MIELEYILDIFKHYLISKILGRLSVILPSSRLKTVISTSSIKAIADVILIYNVIFMNISADG